jgi:hypothetical protein
VFIQQLAGNGGKWLYIADIKVTATGMFIMILDQRKIIVFIACDKGDLVWCLVLSLVV